MTRFLSSYLLIYRLYITPGASPVLYWSCRDRRACYTSQKAGGAAHSRLCQSHLRVDIRALVWKNQYRSMTGEYPWCIARVPRQCSSTTHERSCLWHLTGSSVGRLKKSSQFIISALDSPILGLFPPRVYPSIKSYSLQKNQ